MVIHQDRIERSHATLPSLPTALVALQNTLAHTIALVGLDRVRLVTSNLPQRSALDIEIREPDGVWETRTTISKPDKATIRVGPSQIFDCPESLSWIRTHLTTRFPVAVLEFDAASWDNVLFQGARMDLQNAVKLAAQTANARGLPYFSQTLRRLGFTTDPITVFLQPGVPMYYPGQTARYAVEVGEMVFYAVVVDGVIFTGVGLKE